MEFTRRAWAVAASALALAGLAVVTERPILLAAAVAVGAWLHARQYAFVRSLEQTDDALAVAQEVTRDRIATDGRVAATLRATVEGGAPVALGVTAAPPVGVETRGGAAARRLALGRGDERASATFDVRGRVAGRHQFGPVTVRASDRNGLFRATYERTAPCTLQVAPRTPGEIHVGQGGDQFAVAYGDHDAGRRGSGHDPAEIREYTAGDAARRIDWKATARLATPHVREFETETDRPTAMFVDHRAVTGTGREGERELDYLRQVALGLVDNARDHDDPLGCYTVGNEGVTSAEPPRASDDAYARIEQQLERLTPTDAPGDGEVTDTGQGLLVQRTAASSPSPAAARRTAAHLSDDDSSFGSLLRPYFTASDPYVERIVGEPLFGALRSNLGRLPGDAVVAILTDDTNRTEVRETVRAARSGERRVAVFLAPTVLYEPGGLADVEAAYDRYVSFESFRRELDRLELVTAYEVAPGERLDAVLTAGRRRRRSDTQPDDSDPRTEVKG